MSHGDPGWLLTRLPVGCDCRKLHLPGFFHAVVRYGYMDRVSHDEQFVEHLMQVGRYWVPVCL